jgi:hypothetical protein
MTWQRFMRPINLREAAQLFVGLCALLLGPGCSNLPFVKQNKAPTRIFLTDFSTAWTAALEAVANGKDIIRVNNRETGVIETNWIDSSEPRQFLDVFTDEHFFLRSRYKLQVQVREGKKNGQQAVLVRVLKHGQREDTFLGGFNDVESDLLEESVYLYRIGRLIAIQQYSDEQDAKEREIFDDGDTLF